MLNPKIKYVRAAGPTVAADRMRYDNYPGARDAPIVRAIVHREEQGCLLQVPNGMVSAEYL